VDELGRTFDVPGESGPPADYWSFEGTYFAMTRMYASAGYAREELDDVHFTYDEIRPGCYDRAARLEDMDLNGIEASLCFPNYGRFAGQRFSEAEDHELGLACIRAYNDWMVEEWCGPSGGRLIPLCIVPLWDAEMAAAEVTRNAARGVRAVCFSELPQYLGLPSVPSGQWDPFLATCDETKTVVCMHIGSGTRTFSSGPDMPSPARLTMQFVNSAASMGEYLASGILGRFPNLKLYYAESQVGWIPYILDRLDDAWETYPFRHADRDPREIPSSFYWNRVYSCMFKDRVGTRLLDLIGEDQVMFESDYPHGDGTWPHTPERARTVLCDLPQEVQYKILRGNAIRLLGLNLDVDLVGDSPRSSNG
jgi:predicted TIM-barrel fold metal-dependent hydrolase